MAGHPVFAGVYALMSKGMESGPLGQARRELVSTAEGVVVDLGSGLGANLAHLGPAVTRVHAIEPDPHMVRRLRRNVPPTAVVHEVGAERLPLDDASADTVLATLTLCSVQDPDAVAHEIRRVLRPGGRLLVLEHVRSQDPGLARWQTRLERPWRFTAGDCRLTRDTAATLADAGFDVSGVERIRVPGGPLLREWLRGIAMIADRPGAAQPGAAG